MKRTLTLLILALLPAMQTLATPLTMPEHPQRQEILTGRLSAVTLEACSDNTDHCLFTVTVNLVPKGISRPFPGGQTRTYPFSGTQDDYNAAQELIKTLATNNIPVTGKIIHRFSQTNTRDNYRRLAEFSVSDFYTDEDILTDIDINKALRPASQNFLKTASYTKYKNDPVKSLSEYNAGTVLWKKGHIAEVSRSITQTPSGPEPTCTLVIYPHGYRDSPQVLKVTSEEMCQYAEDLVTAAQPALFLTEEYLCSVLNGSNEVYALKSQ